MTTTDSPTTGSAPRGHAPRLALAVACAWALLAAPAAAAQSVQLQQVDPPAPLSADAPTEALVLRPGESTPRLWQRDAGGGQAVRYRTLSGALVDNFAAREGLSTEQFLSQHALASASLPGVDGALDSAALDQRLAQSGLSFDGSRVRSLGEFVSGLAVTPSADSAVTLQAGRWAEQVSAQQMPQLRRPGALGDASLSQESLLFGLFAKESLTDLVANHPDVFAEVSSRGVGTAASKSAFRDSMLTAWDRIDAGAADSLLDGCSAGFMASMASGDLVAGERLAGRDCGSCAVAGVAGHHMMNRLFELGDGSNSTLLRPGDDQLAVQEWASMQDWVADAVLDANPQLGAELDGPGGQDASVCRAGAATDTVSSMLPDVYAGLLD